jgi:hypothetical protein
MDTVGPPASRPISLILAVYHYTLQIMRTNSCSLCDSPARNLLFLSDFWLTITPTTPHVFVSAESKGLSNPVSSLFATLTGDFISVAAKGLREGKKWRCENGKWQERGRAGGASDGEGFRGIAMGPLVSTNGGEHKIACHWG